MGIPIESIWIQDRHGRKCPPAHGRFSPKPECPSERYLKWLQAIPQTLKKGLSEPGGRFLLRLGAWGGGGGEQNKIANNK